MASEVKAPLACTIWSDSHWPSCDSLVLFHVICSFYFNPALLDLTMLISYHFIISYIWLHCHSRDLFEDKLHVAPHSKWPLSSELRCSHRYSRHTCCEKERGEKRTRRHGEPRTTLIITDPVKSSLKILKEHIKRIEEWYGMIWNDMEWYIESHGKSTGVYTRLYMLLFLRCWAMFFLDSWPAIYV